MYWYTFIFIFIKLWIIVCPINFLLVKVIEVLKVVAKPLKAKLEKKIQEMLDEGIIDQALVLLTFQLF